MPLQATLHNSLTLINFQQLVVSIILNAQISINQQRRKSAIF